MSFSYKILHSVSPLWFFHVTSYELSYTASASVLFSKYKCIGFSCMVSENVLLNAMQIDPYLRIGEDLQLYVRLQSDLGSYGSESDQEVAKSMLSDCRTKVGINDQRVLDVIASALCNFVEVSLLHGRCDFAICLLFVFLIETVLPDGQGCTSKGAH